jgi:hypothetical protein
VHSPLLGQSHLSPLDSRLSVVTCEPSSPRRACENGTCDVLAAGEWASRAAQMKRWVDMEPNKGVFRTYCNTWASDGQYGGPSARCERPNGAQAHPQDVFGSFLPNSLIPTICGSRRTRPKKKWVQRMICVTVRLRFSASAEPAGECFGEEKMFSHHILDDSLDPNASPTSAMITHKS